MGWNFPLGRCGLELLGLELLGFQDGPTALAPPQIFMNHGKKSKKEKVSHIFSHFSDSKNIPQKSKSSHFPKSKKFAFSEI